MFHLGKWCTAKSPAEGLVAELSLTQASSSSWSFLQREAATVEKLRQLLVACTVRLVTETGCEGGCRASIVANVVVPYS